MRIPIRRFKLTIANRGLQDSRLPFLAVRGASNSAAPLALSDGTLA
jgi:hypothetical protein